MNTRIAAIFIAVTGAATAQTVGIGAKAGVPLTAYFDTGTAPVRGGTLDYSSDTRRYTFGPTLELRFNTGISLEVDALYKRFNYTRVENTSVSGVVTNSSVTVDGNSWDIPVMMKYRWPQRVAPFVAGGFVMRYLQAGRARGVSTVQTAQGTTTTQIDTEESFPLFVPGATIAGGIEIGSGRIRLIPEVRYSRWRATSISGPLQLRPNQAELLFGVVF